MSANILFLKSVFGAVRKLRNDIRRATKSDLISHVNEFRKRQKYARIPAVLSRADDARKIQPLTSKTLAGELNWSFRKCLIKLPNPNPKYNHAKDVSDVIKRRKVFRRHLIKRILDPEKCVLIFLPDLRFQGYVNYLFQNCAKKNPSIIPIRLKLSC